MHQDLDFWAARFSPAEQAVFRLKPGRHAWLHIAHGAGMLNGTPLHFGDGAAVSQEEILEIRAVEKAELLLFDLA